MIEYIFSVIGKPIKILTHNPVDNDNKLLAPANATICDSNSGNAEINEPLAAAIILPLPAPDAIANDRALNGVIVAKNPEIIPKNTAPKTVPKIYIAMTPRPSGELIPSLSIINPTFGSRPME